jgi:hypothetical protein
MTYDSGDVCRNAPEHSSDTIQMSELSWSKTLRGLNTEDKTVRPVITAKNKGRFYRTFFRPACRIATSCQFSVKQVT